MRSRQFGQFPSCEKFAVAPSEFSATISEISAVHTNLSTEVFEPAEILKHFVFFIRRREARLIVGRLFTEVISRMDEPRKSVRSRGWG
jgi:hypothetical protein